MANSYNSNPIIIDTDMASGWRALQTLNTGNLPSTIQSGSVVTPRQFGIWVWKIILESNGTTVAGTVNVTDPNDSTVLWTDSVPATAGPAGTVIPNDSADNNPIAQMWRDFKVTGVTGTVTKILIWYR